MFWSLTSADEETHTALGRAEPELNIGTKPMLFGGDGGGVPRVPIPNTTVKPSSADGTWIAGSRESRTPPSNIP